MDLDDLHGLQIDDGNGAGDRRAVDAIGDDRRAGGVDLEVRLRGCPAAFIADIGEFVVAVSTMLCGALPTRICAPCVSGGVAVKSILVSVLFWFSSAYALLPSLENATPPGYEVPVRIERAAGSAVVADRAVREAFDETVVRRHGDVGVVGQRAVGQDVGDGDVAAVLAEHQVLAVRRIGDAAIAAAGVPERQIDLHDYAGAWCRTPRRPGTRPS